MVATKILGLVVLLAGCGIVQKGTADPRDIEDRMPLTSECPVHHRSFVVAVEPLEDARVQYGPERDEYLAAEKQSFPFALTEMKIGQPPKTHVRFGYCPDCRKAEQEWYEEHTLRPQERDLLRRFAEGKSVAKAGAEMGLDPAKVHDLFMDAVGRLDGLRIRAAGQDASR
jgi:hypothetical protein